MSLKNITTLTRFGLTLGKLQGATRRVGVVIFISAYSWCFEPFLIVYNMHGVLNVKISHT